MARLTGDTRRQLSRLNDHFIAKDRPRAADLLNAAVEQAKRAADDPRTRASRAPRPDPGLSEAGFSWIKVHRHRVAFVVGADGEAMIHHIAYEAADFPPRIPPRSD